MVTVTMDVQIFPTKQGVELDVPVVNAFMRMLNELVEGPLTVTTSQGDVVSAQVALEVESSILARFR
jgi:hypothetical protein